LWNYTIPYFSSVVDIPFAKKYLHLVDDIPQSETINWSIHELFQRDAGEDKLESCVDDMMKDRYQKMKKILLASVV
jgi:hypothetical protein